MKENPVGMIKEFRDFAVKGNAIDMAVGIIIGGAFGKIVSSLVNDIIMPPIGLLLGKVQFTDLFYPLDGKEYASIAAAKEAGAPIFAYGSFIQTVIDFVIVAFAIFMVIRGMNKLKKKEEEKPAEPPKPSDEVLLLQEIRDALKRS